MLTIRYSFTDYQYTIAFNEVLIVVGLWDLVSAKETARLLASLLSDLGQTVDQIVVKTTGYPDEVIPL